MHAGDLFDMLLPMLSIYQEYVRNHHYSLQVLTECKQSSPFVALLNRLENKTACHGRSLETFLTYPMHQVRAPRAHKTILVGETQKTDASVSEYSMVSLYFTLLLRRIPLANGSTCDIHFLAPVFFCKQTNFRAKKKIEKTELLSRRYECLFRNNRSHGIVWKEFNEYCMRFDELVKRVTRRIYIPSCALSQRVSRNAENYTFIGKI